MAVALGYALSLICAAFLVAGCVTSGGASGGPNGSSSVAPAPTFDATTGAIEGTVADDEGVPLSGVIVGLLPGGTQATSDATGRFVLNGIAAGTYSLAAQKLGYDSAAKTVTVNAGEVTRTSFVLRALAVKEGYSHQFSVKGYFECSWTFVITTGPCFYPITGTNTSVVPVDPWTNNKRQFDYHVDPGVMTVYNEMTWGKTTAATGDQMSVFLSYQKRTGSHWYCNGAHVDPVVIRWDRDADSTSDKTAGTCRGGGASLPSAEPQTIPMGGQVLTSRANTGPSNYVPGVGFALQQSFTLYISIFYWEHAPDSFTALPDK